MPTYSATWTATDGTIFETADYVTLDECAAGAQLYASNYEGMTPAPGTHITVSCGADVLGLVRFSEAMVAPDADPTV